MGMTAPLHIDMQMIAKELDIWIHFEDTHSMMLKRDGMYSIVLNQKVTRRAMAGFCARTVPCAEAYREPFSYEQAVQGTAGISGQPFYVPLLCADLYAVKHGAAPAEEPRRYFNRSRFPGDGIICGKRLELFERRKAGIQFQKRLACLLSDKRPNVYYGSGQTHLHAAEEKRRILLKISDSPPA